MEMRVLMLVFLVSMVISVCQQTSVISATQHYLKKMTGYKLTGPVLSLVSWQVYHGDWTMVFRGQPRILSSVYTMWRSTGVKNDFPLDSIPYACLRLDNTAGCTQHFRSQILDNWVNIDQVRYSLYKNGVEVKYITFDGTDTDKESWFSQSKVLETSWPDLASTAPPLQYFNFVGFSSRRFYTAKHGECAGDAIFTSTIDRTYMNCYGQWGLNPSSYPLFLYSPTTSMVTLSTKAYDSADVMAVFVKFV